MTRAQHGLALRMRTVLAERDPSQAGQAADLARQSRAHVEAALLHLGEHGGSAVYRRRRQRQNQRHQHADHGRDGDQKAVVPDDPP